MNRKARRVLVVCIAVIVAVACAAVAVIQTLHLREMKQQLDSMTEQLAQQKQKLEDTQKQLEEEQAARAAEEAYTRSRSDQLAQAAEAKEKVTDGDEIGRVWVEGTQLDCSLYWGDTGSQFRSGAGVHAADGCVLPGENGTVFVGGHTDSWFEDLKSAQVGGIIHLETPWGNFSYKITETKVIEETDIDQCRWGDTTPSCILYTCYPFGIQTRTTQRYLVYADPVESDADGVIPDDLLSGAEAAAVQG